jgi:predicted phage-related endonuclease
MSADNIEQRTEEWFAKRAGKFTGSRFADLLARNKKTGAPLKAWHDLIWDVTVERLSGQAVEGPNGFALQWGKDVEPFAREAYELASGNLVTMIDFLEHPRHAYAGCSPDGLIGAEGGLEMKCPKNSAIHLQRFLDGVPEEYLPQIQGSLWVSGRQWWDFASYDPRMPESHRLFLARVERDEAMIAQIAQAAAEAEEMVEDLLRRLRMAVEV